MARLVSMGEDSRARLVAGVDQLADAVGSTLGPRGRYVICEREKVLPREQTKQMLEGLGPIVSNDGATVANHMHFSDPVEEMGADLVRAITSQADKAAGDGTTTATVLARALVDGAVRLIAAGANPLALRRGVQGAGQLAAYSFKKIAADVTNKDQLAHVAAISSKDPEIGRMVADALDHVGKEGHVKIDDSNTVHTELELTDGMTFERGLRHPAMATDRAHGVAELEEPLVLLTNLELTEASQVIPVLEIALAQHRPLLIVAEKLDDEALATVVRNVTAGVVQVAEVDPPAYAEGRRKCMEDLAIFTGATYVDHEVMGYTMADVTPDMLGSADRVVVGPKFTQVIGGHGDVVEIRNRVADLRRRIADSDYEFNRDRMVERLSRLTGGTATIRVGGVSEENVNEQKLRFEDAINAGRAALQEGVVPGGGVAYLEAQRAVRMYEETLAGDERAGAHLVELALEEPLRQQARNAGEAPGVVVEKVRELGYGTVFDAQGLGYAKASEAGILDPAKVCRVALQCAVSVASALLAREASVVDAETPDRTIRELVDAAAGMGR